MNVSHLATIGSRTGGPLFDVRLSGVAVTPQDWVYALGDDRVVSFTADYLSDRSFPLGDIGWSLLAEHDGVWIGFDGRLIAYDVLGQRRTTLEDPARLGRITAIALADDCLILADATHRAVFCYSRTGEFQRQLGAAANTRGFMIPNGILDLARDAQDQTVLVAHPQKHRVERYDADGTLIGTWGRFGMHDPGDFGGCCNPTNIAVAHDGLIAVSEKAPPRIKLYRSTGEFAALVPSDVFDPHSKNIDLAFDSRQRLYATDPTRRVIHVFQIDGP